MTRTSRTAERVTRLLWLAATGCGLLAAGCAADANDPQRRQVDTPNELGVTSIETESSGEANGESVFELRAFNASGTEVGSVRRQIAVTERPEWDGDDGRRTELTVTAVGALDFRAT